MKKSISLILLSFISTLCFAQENGNYILHINNDSISINLNEYVEYESKSGEKTTFKITQSNIQTYMDDMISFSHSKFLNISNTEIENGIEQCMALNSNGNGFLVQKYSTIDPSSLTALMLNEITKESVNYGYEKKEKPFKKKLVSGHTIEGTEATLTYKGEDQIYTVATYGGKDEGILVVTMLIYPDALDDTVIDLFLDTLEIKD